MPLPEEIINEASRLKKKNEELAEKTRLNAEKQPEPKIPEITKFIHYKQPDTYLTYRYLFVNATFLYLFGLLGVGLPLFVYFILIPSGQMENGEIYLLMIWAAWFVLSETFIFLLYLRFKDWRTRLPFEVEGWLELVNRENFTNAHYWRKSTIQLKLAQNTSPELTEALLYIFCDKANRQFYFSEDGAMEHWTIVGTSVKGAINRKVAVGLCRFIDRYLVKSHQNGDIQIEKIIIRTSKEVEYFSAPSSD